MGPIQIIGSNYTTGNQTEGIQSNLKKEYYLKTTDLMVIEETEGKTRSCEEAVRKTLPYVSYWKWFASWSEACNIRIVWANGRVIAGPLIMKC